MSHVISSRVVHSLSQVDLICFSHLRWAFVFDRPQHLLSRMARHRRVFFVEEPLLHDGPAKLELRREAPNLTIVVPRIPADTAPDGVVAIQKSMIDQLINEQDVGPFIAWYYTPMALQFTKHLRPAVTIYDCMDQLSHVQGAPSDMSIQERALMGRADHVFTSGRTIFDDKRHQHHSVYAFPSTVDAAHFRRARCVVSEPADHARIPRPRLGYLGVIDERIDLDLIDRLATSQPEWQIIMAGPVTRIDQDTLPRRSNIHYLGPKPYAELPEVMASWSVGLLPFARNDATKFISPSKTPEYLAAGLPVVSTSIRDVIAPYGDQHLVAIADHPDAFADRVREQLAMSEESYDTWLARADDFLKVHSWDRTFAAMLEHVDKVIARRVVLRNRYSSRIDASGSSTLANLSAAAGRISGGGTWA